MKTKLVIAIILIAVNPLFSQSIDSPLIIDSLLNVINHSYRNDSLFRDSGNIINGATKASIGFARRSRYLNKRTGAITLEVFRQEFTNGIIFFDSYYYWMDKVIFVERIRLTKTEADRPRAFYVWDNCLFEKIENGFVACSESVKLVGNRILIKSN